MPLTQSEAKSARARLTANSGDGFQESANIECRMAGAQAADRLIRHDAHLAHAGYPQYADHWAGDAWRLVRFTRNITTKGGLRFVAGDVTIARYGRSDLDPTAYSIRGGINVGVLPGDFREFGREEKSRTKPKQATWHGQPGEWFDVLATTKHTGPRVAVQRWLENGEQGRKGEVEVRAIVGDGRHADFRQHSTATLHEPSAEELEAAITEALGFLPPR